MPKPPATALCSSTDGAPSSARTRASAARSASRSATSTGKAARARELGGELLEPGRVAREQRDAVAVGREPPRERGAGARPDSRHDADPLAIAPEYADLVSLRNHNIV